MNKRASLIPISILSVSLLGCAGTGSEGGDPVDVGSTGAPGAAASPAATAAGSPASGGSPAATTPTGQAVADGTYTFQVAEAGMVAVTVTGDDLALASVTPAEGWQHREDVDDDGDDRDIEIDFIGGDREAEFDAELEGGTLEVEIDWEAPASDGSHSFPVADAGTVTVDVTGTETALAGTELADGWELSERTTGGDVELYIANPAESTWIEFEADIDDGRLDVEIDIDIGLEIGPRDDD